jgi:hypothetical protein
VASPTPLHVAIPTPLKVTFPSPLPVTVPTPLHVKLPGGPLRITIPTPLDVHAVGGPPEWLLWWAFGLSCIAVVIAAATFVAVLVQMRMALVQARPARNEPVLAPRRPNLSLRFADGAKEFSFTSYRRHLSLPLSITNDGDKASTDFRVRLFFPLETQIGTERRQIGEDEYLVNTLFFAGPEHRMYPGDTMTFTIPDVVCASSFEFLWTIDDEDGRYPSVGFGKLRVRAQRDQRQSPRHAGDEEITSDLPQLEPGERLLKNYVERCVSETTFAVEPVQKLETPTSGAGFGNNAVQVFATDLAMYGLRVDGERELQRLDRSHSLRRVITGATHHAYAVIDVDQKGHLFVAESISR